MSYCALYRKYRPATLDEVAGQNKIVKILTNSLTNGHISHAYLFYGPKGTGKTTISKLIAKMVNCSNLVDNKPCNCCESCKQFNEKSNPDIVEIDAASNNGVDEVREIRNKVSFLPSISKYRVYIIDEVHMLSTGAFNALLKTLEEPPGHVIFILATTEYYKVPATIISRCQCFEFGRINKEAMINRLEYIANKEKIKYDSSILQLIANSSDGAMRDAIGLLEKLALYSNNKIKEEDFYRFKGMIRKEEIINITKKISDGEVESVINFVNDAYLDGKDLFLLLENILNVLTEKIIDNSKNNISNNNLYKVIDILYKANNDMKNSDNFKMFLEISLIRCCDLLGGNSKVTQSKPMVDKEDLVAPPKIKKAVELKDDSKTEKLVVDEAVLVETDDNSREIRKFIDERVNNALALADKEQLLNLKSNNFDAAQFLHSKEFSSVVSFLIDGEIRVVGDKNVIISLKYESMVENANKDLTKLENLFSLVYKKFYKLIFVSDDDWKNIKKDYVAMIKNGVTYEYKEEEIPTYPVKRVTKKNAVDKAVDFFGEEVVVVE